MCLGFSDLEQRIEELLGWVKEDEVVIDNIWYPFGIENNIIKDLLIVKETCHLLLGNFRLDC